MCTDEYFASLLTISWFKILNGTMCKVLQTGYAVYTAKIKQKRSILIQQLQLRGALMCSVIRGNELH